MNQAEADQIKQPAEVFEPEVFRHSGPPTGCAGCEADAYARAACPGEETH